MRETRSCLTKRKNNEAIKENSKFEERVVLVEDITESRCKLLKTVKESEQVDFAYVKDGVIVVKKRSGSFVKINVDDLSV